VISATAGRTVTGAAGAAADAADERFWLEFQVAGGAWDRGPLLSCGGVRFEEALPVRPFRFEKGLRNFAGWWYFATSGVHVGFESWLERPVDRTTPGVCLPEGRLTLQTVTTVASRGSPRLARTGLAVC
jgi:hypothetical protein